MNKMNNYFLCVLLMLLSSNLLSAQTNWTGNADTDWDNPGNWTPGVPGVGDDVSIPVSANQPVIGGSTNALAKSVEVAANATLDIISGGELNIDGSTVFGLRNSGILTNGGTINMGLNSFVLSNGIVNEVSGVFFNNGAIVTAQVAVAGAHVILSKGDFTNDGTIDIGDQHHPGAFPILVLEGGLFTNNNTININNITPYATGKLRVQQPGSKLINNGTIDMNTTGLFVSDGGTLINSACAEILETRASIQVTGTIDNYGLMTMVAFHPNGGGWNNFGTIQSVQTQLINSGNPVNNDDLIILPLTLTNNCGELSPAFGIGSNLGSTVTIYTDAAATTSAGSYNSTTNTFTPNFALSNTTYNLYVKVEDDANTCTDYILPWNLTVNTAPCCNLTTWTGNASTDWDDANNWDTYLVPTACNDVSIPALANQPVIGGSTNALAKSVEVAANATLDISSGGVLNIDGSTYRGFGNLGTVTNDGTINMGLNSHITNNGIVNEGSGYFTNNGSIVTDDVADGGGNVVFTSGTGIFTNNGDISIGASPAFGLTAYSSGTFVNNGTVTNNVPSQAIQIAGPTGIPELQNNGVINTVGGIFINVGVFNNTACAELYAGGFNIAAAAGTVNNEGLMQFSNNSNNSGTWNNMGTIHSLLPQILSSGNPINNDDLIILPVTLTNNCGELNPAFGIGSNLGSTVSIYTDAGATMSVGTYNSTTNTYTPNFALSNTTYNLYQ